MDIKDEIERLRRRPFIKAAEVGSIPCQETSDPKRLCTSPIVSVHVVTYNQEGYICQTLDSILQQTTDFEYEIVIGEDASSDKTREICFEYQRRFPDKIRVLWSSENTFYNDGNTRRVAARCRGEFIAFCEGDDYWTDVKKLQKQVDVMRRNPSVSLCFTGGQRLLEASGKLLSCETKGKYSCGLTRGAEFFDYYVDNPSFWVFTPGIMCRTQALAAFDQTDVGQEVSKYATHTSDLILVLSLCLVGDVYGIPDPMVVYRQGVGISCVTPTSISGINGVVSRYWMARLAKREVIASKLLERIFRRYLRRAPLLPSDKRCELVKWICGQDLFASHITKVDGFILLLLGVRFIPSWVWGMFLKIKRCICS